MWRFVWISFCLFRNKCQFLSKKCIQVSHSLNFFSYFRKLKKMYIWCLSELL